MSCGFPADRGGVLCVRGCVGRSVLSLARQTEHLVLDCSTTLARAVRTPARFHRQTSNGLPQFAKGWISGGDSFAGQSRVSRFDYEHHFTEYEHDQKPDDRPLAINEAAPPQGQVRLQPTRRNTIAGSTAQREPQDPRHDRIGGPADRCRQKDLTVSGTAQTVMTAPRSC